MTPADPNPRATEEAPQEQTKIIPRNLTAYADVKILGNPANSRTESGVDNSYPGLEFDPRNLEQIFFPGLKFEFHRNDGARLVEVGPDFEARCDLSALRSEKSSIYIWAIFRVGNDGALETFDCDQLAGMRVWRIVRQLGPEAVCLVLGQGASRGVLLSDLADAVTDQLKKASEGRNPQASVYATAGQTPYALASDVRSAYLNDWGVIDPDRLAPGELTKTMCAPWMYDFRDCYCFYWAANKPDMVAATDPAGTQVNFLRSNRQAEPPDQDQSVWEGREGKELTHADVAAGAWRGLPIVLSDRESATGEFIKRKGSPRSLDRARVVAEFARLATVEHALLVEYLFAHYSLRNSPLGSTEPNCQAALRFAKEEILGIAKDEMRHFLWVNRVLQLLGASPSVRRARTIQLSPGLGRTRSSAKLARPFELRPLKRARLQEFIDVERPSRSIGKGLDGMYVQILEWIEQQPSQELTERGDVAPIVKLIVDEGESHYSRFVAIEAALKPFDERDYLRDLGPPKDDVDRQYLLLSDLYYNVILDSVEASFGLAGLDRAEFLSASIRSMRNLDEIAELLSARGVAPRLAIKKRASGLNRSAKSAQNLDLRLKQISKHLRSLPDTRGEHAKIAAHGERVEAFRRQAKALLSGEKTG